jgi:hypothetical protein
MSAVVDELADAGVAEFSGVAKFMTLATDELVYLSHQVRTLLGTTHEERLRLFHREPIDPPSAPGLCAGMLRALLHFSWNAHARALLVDSGVVSADRVDDVLACQSPPQIAFAHANFTNMCLALWMLSVSQFSADWQSSSTTSRDGDGVSHIDAILDEFVVWTVVLRSRNDAASSRESAASFVFNMAVPYFLFQSALQSGDAKLQAVVLKAFFPVWFLVEPRGGAGVTAASFEALATQTLHLFLTVQANFTDQALDACVLPTNANGLADGDDNGGDGGGGGN